MSTLFKIVLCFFVVSVSAFGLKGEEPKPIKLLILSGGHGFQEKEFYKIFDEMPGIEYETAVLPKDMDRLAPGLEKKYALIISYDMNQFPITEKQREQFQELFKRGMPWMVFHHSIAGYQNWSEYRKIAGGHYFEKPVEIDGIPWPKSTYKHDVKLDITVVDKEHPITKGINDFQIIDEAYGGVYVSPDVRVLLKTDNPDASKEIAWVHRYENSPVFTILLGHDSKSFENRNLRKILEQGIRWLASNENDNLD